MKALCGWVTAAALAAGLGAVLAGASGAAEPGELVVYSGRSKALVGPVFAQFEKQTGIKVEIKYGNTPELALLLREEGDRSRADVYWSQDAGALGAITKAGLFADLPKDVVDAAPPMFRHSGGKWVATSGRARVIAYSSRRVKPDELPKSIFDLTGSRYKGRVGWAPTNASFQAFVTAMRKMYGDAKTRQWLLGMKANDPKDFKSNAPIITAIASGEIDFGLPNHYYLLGFKKAEDVIFPVDQAFFEAGDVGNLVNVAGMGILRSAKHPEAADRFVRFVLSPTAQQYFASDISEYPVIDGVILNAGLSNLDELQRVAPPVKLDDLDDLEGTLALLREVGLL